MRAALALLLALALAPAWAEAPAPKKPRPAAQKAQPAQKAHAKPTPAQVRKFNELERKQAPRP